MRPAAQSLVRVALACGGSGGHLFPGLAVAEQLARRNCAVTLLVSDKQVDQRAIKAVAGMDIFSLPAVGLKRGSEIAFLRGLGRSYFAAKKLFRACPPHAVLATGGFTSVPPILAARRLGARTFLHESNAIPGRANRWLSRIVDLAFVGFPEAAARLRTRKALFTGTPVRAQFYPREAAACRLALGLDPARPVLLVMGGSQGATGINELMLQSLPLLAKAVPELQWFHLAGPGDTGRQSRKSEIRNPKSERRKISLHLADIPEGNATDGLKQAYAASGLKAIVHPFFDEMELALGSATVAVSRAGASSLAELAAMRVPPILVPYPHATDQHQLRNARAFERTGAARLLEQKTATPEALVGMVQDLVCNASLRAQMERALAHWHRPDAADQIADAVLEDAEIATCDRHSPSPRTPA